MREIALSKTKENNLRHHGWVQYVISELKDEEIVLVKGVGECAVREITKGLVELWIVKEEELKP